LIEDELARRRSSLSPDEIFRREADWYRKTTIAFANEGAEKARLDEAVAKRKRDAEDKKKWEGES
jgi:DnaJ family protein C protein 8